jgi:hypothetical protein
MRKILLIVAGSIVLALFAVGLGIVTLITKGNFWLGFWCPISAVLVYVVAWLLLGSGLRYPGLAFAGAVAVGFTIITIVYA